MLLQVPPTATTCSLEEFLEVRHNRELVALKGGHTICDVPSLENSLRGISQTIRISIHSCSHLCSRQFCH
jgi:hypothetical protein